MGTPKNRIKLADINRDNAVDHPRKNQARDTIIPRNQEYYITQVSEEIEGRVTRKLSQEFSRTKSCLLGCLSKLDEFLLNTHGPVPETSRSSNGENQQTNEDRSQNDPHPEVGVSLSQSSQAFSPDETFCINLRSKHRGSSGASQASK